MLIPFQVFGNTTLRPHNIITRVCVILIELTAQIRYAQMHERSYIGKFQLDVYVAIVDALKNPSDAAIQLPHVSHILNMAKRAANGRQGRVTGMIGTCSFEIVSMPAMVPTSGSRFVKSATLIQKDGEIEKGARCEMFSSHCCFFVTITGVTDAAAPAQAPSLARK